MSDQTLALIVALVAVVGSVLTSVVTAVFAYRSTRLAKEAEERIANKEQIINAAYKNWERRFDFVTQQGAGVTRTVLPLSEYIVMISKYVSLLDEDITAERLAEKTKEIVEIQVALRNHQQLMKERFSREY